MQRRSKRRLLRQQAPMAYRLSRQGRPSLLRAYAWRALQGAARTLPSSDLQLTRVELPLPHLARDLDGLSVLHVSDLHLTEGMHPADAIIPLLRGMRCDIVVYTGDLADDETGLPALAALFEALKPREAAFAVLGNHDHYHYHHSTGEGPTANNIEPLIKTIKDSAVHLLTNSNVALYNGLLHVVGVDDPALGRDDLETAFKTVEAEDATILLAHSPDVLVRLGDRRPGLLLAGHTHGGQFRLPGIGPLGSVSTLPRRYAMGLYIYDGIQTFVSRGVGTSGAPARLYCPPEVTVMTLRAPH